MCIRSLAVWATLVATSIATTTTNAQPINESFHYQGLLEENGAPANGMYDVAFNLMDAEFGGVFLADSIVFDDIEVVDGLLECFVDFGPGTDLFRSDEYRWIDVRVRPHTGGPYSILFPRQRLAPTPVANYAIKAGTTLNDAYQSGNIISMDSAAGLFEIHSSDVLNAGIRLRSEFGALRAAMSHSNFGGGSFDAYSPSSDLVAVLRYDASPGGGGSLGLASNGQGLNGIQLDGNGTGTEHPRLRFFNGLVPFDLNSHVTGDPSVIIPNDSINATEILNEVGAAEVADSSGTVLTEGLAAIDVLNSVTISAPADGYVLVLASAEFTVSHISGTSSSINIGVSSSPVSFANNTDLELNVPSGAPNGIYEYPITTHAIFPASQGLNTYYFLADKNYLNGGVQVLDRQLSAIYIPTAYGSLARQPGQDIPDEYAPMNAPMRALDILREQNAALQANADRQQRELDAMKFQVQQLIEQSQIEHAKQNQD